MMQKYLIGVDLGTSSTKAALYHSDGMLVAEAAADVPLKIFSTPEDIANMALFLASDQARTITGQAINVDAGFTI